MVAPVITSNSGGATAAVSIAENITAVTTVSATDVDASTTLSYSISGGADAARFAINAATGALSFIAAPNFEAASDSGANNVYDVVVQVSDGTLTDTQAIAVTVTDADEVAPMLLGSSPSDGRTGVAMDGNAVVTFSEAVQRGTGLIELRSGSATGTVVETFDAATSSRIVISGSNLTIDPTSSLANDTSYFITFASGAIKDLAGNSYADTTTYDFSTAPAPNTTAPTFLTRTHFVTVDLGGAEAASSLALQADGKVLMGGTIQGFGGDFALVRLLADGTLDADFNGTGFRVSEGGYYQADSGTGLAIQSDGKIVQAGYTLALNSMGGSLFTVLRFNGDGSPDTTFSGDGIVNTSIAGNDRVAAVTMQADGKIVIIGTSAGDDFVFARYGTDGSIDVVSTFRTASWDRAAAVFVQADGSVFLAGSTGSLWHAADFAIMKLNSHGSIEGTFGGGLVLTDFGGVDSAASVLVQGDGKVIAAGTRNKSGVDFALVRYDTQGNLDPGFGTGGMVFTDFLQGQDILTQAVLQPDGKILVLGTTTKAFDTANPDPDILVVRYNADGTLDGSFGNGGFIDIDLGGAEDAGAIALRPDGRIVIAGRSFPSFGSFTSDFLLVGLNADGSPDRSFLASGLDAESLSVPENGAAIATLAASDPDAGTSLHYAIVGGTDAALFILDAASGTLAFRSAPDFEVPVDAGGDNVYDVVVEVSDGALVDTLAIAVAVKNVVDGERVMGTAGANSLAGSAFADSLRGLAGNDTLRGNAGNDLIAGGAGVDLAIYSTSLGQAQVTRNADKSLAITTSLDGTDTVTGVEQFRFSDGLYSFTFRNPGPAVIANFNAASGWASQDQFPRHVADMNGDGYADVVGFGFAGTFVSYGSAAGTFSGATLVLSNFGQTAGWTSDNQFHREVVDVNGDGRADIVGFGQAGTLVSLARSDGSFADPILGVANFGVSQGWTTQDGFARTLGDVNGDGFVDIVGFGVAGTLVSLGNGNGTFQPVQTGIANFGVSQGWSSDNAFHRAVADVTGDGRDDIIGFGIAGTFVAVSKGDGTFDPAQLVLNNFGANQGWSSDDKFSRLLADVNGDHVADIVGFGIAGTLISFGKGDGTFSDASFDLANFGANQGWNSDNAYHRTIADMNNDGLADIVGFGIAGVLVGLNDGTILL